MTAIALQVAIVEAKAMTTKATATVMNIKTIITRVLLSARANATIFCNSILLLHSPAQNLNTMNRSSPHPCSTHHMPNNAKNKAETPNIFPAS